MEDRMRRREVMAAMAGVAAWPMAAHAQRLGRWSRIGFLGLAPASGWVEAVNAFRAGMRELGYAEGDSIIIEFRWAPTTAALPEVAAELVHTGVDIILAPASTQVEP